MATTTQTTLLADLSPEMKTFYSMELLEEAKPNLVHNQFNKHVPLPQGKGKTIEWRKFSNFDKATTPLTEGVTPDGHGLVVSTVTATVDQYGDWSRVSDVLQMTAIDPVIVEYTDRHASNMGLTLDTIARNELQSGTQVIYAPNISGTTETPVTSRAAMDGTGKLTGKLVAKAATALKKKNAPTINGDYVAIIHPSVAYDLRRDPEWLEAHKYAAPNEIFEGEIGKLHGVRFVESTEAKIYCGEDLASNSRTLQVNGNITANTQKTITFDGGTVAENALKGKYIVVDGKTYKVKSNTATVITVDSESNLPAISNDVYIYPEGNASGGAVYGCLFMGKEPANDVELEGGNAHVIVKQLGSAGTEDPLDQRSSVGWKATGYCTKIVYNEYIVRVEVCSEYSTVDEGN